jgi:hypothetical protein
MRSETRNEKQNNLPDPGPLGLRSAVRVSPAQGSGFERLDTMKAKDLTPGSVIVRYGFHLKVVSAQPKLLIMHDGSRNVIEVVHEAGTVNYPPNLEVETTNKFNH